jgi:hypothetical protein
VFAEHAVLLPTPALVRNDGLSADGVAAILLNTLGGSTSGGHPVVWLMPGVDGAGSGPPSIWSVFPDWSRLALGWALVVGVLLALWRGRRLGAPVVEPLPVIVRSAEIVEGHGRLYERAQARERVASILRSAAARRLRARGEVEAVQWLEGPPPDSDATLLALALHLDRVEGRSVPPSKGSAP